MASEAMKRPLFSCVMPVNGSRPFMDEALASLSAQGMGDDLEVIVQDGDIEPDAGQSDALNKGFAKAKGEWFFWLNADDVLLPGALESVLDRINSKVDRVEWIVGNQLLIDDAGKVLKCSVGNGWHGWLYRSAVPHVYGPSAFFRHELFEKIGGFNAELKYCMDWDLWIRLMKAGVEFTRVGDYLWAQRQWVGSKTQRPLSSEEMAAHLAEVNRMCTQNGFKMTKSGAWLTRVVRLLEGCYLKEFVDGLKWKGRTI